MIRFFPLDFSSFHFLIFISTYKPFEKFFRCQKKLFTGHSIFFSLTHVISSHSFFYISNPLEWDLSDRLLRESAGCGKERYELLRKKFVIFYCALYILSRIFFFFLFFPTFENDFLKWKKTCL